MCVCVHLCVRVLCGIDVFTCCDHIEQKVLNKIHSHTREVRVLGVNTRKQTRVIENLPVWINSTEFSVGVTAGAEFSMYVTDIMQVPLSKLEAAHTDSYSTCAR